MSLNFFIHKFTKIFSFYPLRVARIRGPKTTRFGCQKHILLFHAPRGKCSVFCKGVFRLFRAAFFAVLSDKNTSCFSFTPPLHIVATSSIFQAAFLREKGRKLQASTPLSCSIKALLYKSTFVLLCIWNSALWKICPFIAKCFSTFFGSLGFRRR